MRRYTLARFAVSGTRQSRHGAIEGAEGAIAATRMFTAAPRFVDFGFTGVVTVAARDVYYLRQFTHSRFSSLGVPIVVMTRLPFTAADRLAAINASGGYLFGRSYAVPDVSGGVVVVFEEVSGGVVVVFEEVYPI